MTKELRIATPEDARAVWEATQAKGETPTVRGVAAALNASGEFKPIYPKKVWQWRNNEWMKGAEKRPGRPRKRAANGTIQKAAERVLAVAEAAVPKIKDGKPVQDVMAQANPREIAELLNQDFDRLHTLVIEEGMVTQIVLWRYLRGGHREMEVREVADLQKALAGSLIALTQATQVMRGIPAAAPTGDQAKVIEHDELDGAWAAMRKAAQTYSAA